MKKTLFAGLLLTMAACMPPSEVDIAWGPSPWYTYCSWDAPCWYGPNLVFVYGWGYVDRPTYVFLHTNPGRREAWEHRRREWHPGKKPQYRGQDWDAHKRDQDRGHHKDKDKDHGDRDRRDRDH